MRSADPRVVLFNPRDLVLHAARRLGLGTVVVVQTGAAEPSADDVDELMICDWLDDFDVALDRLAPIASSCVAAFGFGEIGCQAAAAANDRFGWPGNTVASIQAFQNKVALREAVGSQAGKPVRHSTCAGPADLLSTAQRIGFPCIVKPISGTGSAGVRYLAGPDDVADYCAGPPADGELLVEEFLSGREVSVEAMSDDGRHRLLAITAKSTTGIPGFVETGHRLPISLDESERRELWKVVSATLTAARHRFGITHTEVILTDAGPRLVESHGRPGGDRISDLIRLATGIDVFEQTIALTLGLDCDLSPSRQLMAGIRYLEFDTTVGRPELDLVAVRALPYVHEVVISVPVGQRPPVVRRSGDRHGFVVATGSDAAELEDHLTNACAALYQQVAHRGS